MQWGEGMGVVYQLVCICFLSGAQVPITSYTCTHLDQPGFQDHGQCTVSGGLRTCAIKEGVRPTLLSSSADLGVYAWNGNTNPFVVLDIPQGWCVGSVKMMFVAPGFQSTVQNGSPPTLTRQCSHLLVKRVQHQL